LAAVLERTDHQLCMPELMAAKLAATAPTAVRVRVAELTGPLLGAAFESGLLPGQSTPGIANVPPPAPRLP
jgi:hypothetical protein